MSPIDYTKFGVGAAPGDGTAINKKWWTLKNKKERAQSIAAVVRTIAEHDKGRQTQYQIGAKLYGNVSLMGLNGLSFSKAVTNQRAIRDRVTCNIVQSVIDTKTAKLAKNKPRPFFLTSGGDYKQMRRAKKLDKFTEGIFYENGAYELGPEILRDSDVFGDGIIHVFEQNGRVKWERVLPSELLVDNVEAVYGRPRQMHRVKVVDRGVLLDLFPDKRDVIIRSDSASAELTGEYQNVADLVVVVESWHLPSGPEAKDGFHCISLEDEELFSEPYKKDFFPFVFLSSSKRLFGHWGQGAAERLQSIQLEVNKILWVIQRSMHLAGTFRLWLKSGSGLPKEHINNDIGAILQSEVKPEYLVVNPVPEQYFSHLQTLKTQAYEQEGVSQLSATSKKPEGLNSGKALREYNDIESDRFTVLGQAYEQFFLDLARVSISVAKDIYEQENSYEVTVPGKRFIETIDWKEIDLEEDQYVMKMFPISSLPDDPAGRLQTITEYIQAGFLTPRQGRRLLDFPDLEQIETLANAQEEYLHQIFEKIVDDGEYTAPEPFDDLQLAKELCLEYYSQARNLGLEDEKLELLRRFYDQVNTMITQATQPPAANGMGTPQAVPEPTPTSDMIPNVPGAAAGAA